MDPDNQQNSSEPETGLPQPSRLIRLAWPERARRRPGVFAGYTDVRGLHQLVYFLLDVGTTDALAGLADCVTIVIQADGRIQVQDNGRGLPITADPLTQQTALERLLTDYDFSLAFDPGGYTTSWGWYTAGATIVNALSAWFRVEVRTQGQVYCQEYAQGVPTGPVTLAGSDPLGRGNTFTFQPDPTIFETLECEYAALAMYLEDWAYWTPGLHITLRDERIGQKQARVFYAPAGLRDWVVALNRDHTVLHAPFHIQATVGQTAIEVALQYTQENTPVRLTPASSPFADWGRTPRIWSFVNHHPTYFGGTHVTGLLTALTRTVNAEARARGLLSPTAPALTSRDIRQGLTALIHVRSRDAKSNNSLGYNLTSPEVRRQVQELVTRAFGRFLAEHPAAAVAILSKIQETARPRLPRGR